MARSNILSKWTSEYCAPVVATVVTAEVENICLHNGLLFHELLSAFGHLDGIHASIRSSNQTISISDAQIRFERITEMKPKSTATIEELLQANFQEFDINGIPSTVGELKASVPSGWSSPLEQLLFRSLSFSEFEMLSHPLVLLTVVSTTEHDVVAAMQELASAHSSPQCLSSGQYDSDLLRVFLLVHDQGLHPEIDATLMLRKLQSKFPPIHTKLIVINSLPVSNPNLQQPDMWTRYVVPMYFPALAPQLNPLNPIPINPLNGSRVLGSRLSMEDFMTLREFCISLFHQEIVPQVERRIATLSKIVSDNRKGVKNVLKSFWRKPREEVTAHKGPIKYRFDRIESQILLLADTYFIVKDYENAMSMYKMVRDDYRADKSNLHLAHSLFMIVMCYLYTEPGRRDLNSQIEAIGQLFSGFADVIPAAAYFAFMAGEVLISQQVRAPLEASQLLLQVSISLSKYSLLSGLLMEKAAALYLIAGQQRKFCLFEVISGLKIYGCGLKPARHAVVCFAVTLLFHDRGGWGGIKGKLAKFIADDLKFGEGGNQSRALILLLKVLNAALDSSTTVCSQDGLRDAVAVLKELSSPGPFGSVVVKQGWEKLNTYSILFSELPLSVNNENPDSASHTEVHGLGVPLLDTSLVQLLFPFNGFDHKLPYGSSSHLVRGADELASRLEIEKNWESESLTNSEISLSERFVEFESEMTFVTGGRGRGSRNSQLQIPLGEPVLLNVKLTNQLPCELQLHSLSLELEAPDDAFQIDSFELVLQPGEQREIQLSATPLTQGTFAVKFVRWNLSEVLTVRQSLQPNAKKSSSSVSAAVMNELSFSVVSPFPLLQLKMSGIEEEVLQGQLVKAHLTIANVGSADACAIDLKISHPFLVLCSDGNESSPPAILSNFWSGSSGTVTSLPRDQVIRMGEVLTISAWFRSSLVGKQSLGVLASYLASREGGITEDFGKLLSPRTSFLSIQTTVFPSVGINAKFSTKTSSSVRRALVLDVGNTIPQTDATGPRHVYPQADSESSCSIGEGSLEEGGLQVDSVVLSGAAHTVMTSVEQLKLKDVVISSNENITLCLPLAADADPDMLPLTLIDSSSLNFSSFHESQNLLNDVLTHFLCLEAAAAAFNESVRQVRHNLALKAQEETEAGPRSIAQVRKERIKEKDSDSPETSSCSSIMDGKAEQASPRQYSTLSDFLLHNRGHGLASLAVTWRCCFKGRLGFGVSLVSPIRVLPNVVAKTPLTEYLFVSLLHDRKAELSKDQRAVMIPVTVQLHSLSPDGLTVSVEAVERKSSTFSATVESQPKKGSKGLRWERKTKYLNINVPPQTTVTLPFMAAISKTGVFDLKRFKVLACSPGHSESSIVIAGQSLIEVL